MVSNVHQLSYTLSKIRAGRVSLCLLALREFAVWNGKEDVSYGFLVELK